MVYLFLNIIIAFFSLGIIRDKNAFFSCPARIEAFFIVFLVLTFSPARAVDRFFIVFSASARSLV